MEIIKHEWFIQEAFLIKLNIPYFFKIFVITLVFFSIKLLKLLRNKKKPWEQTSGMAKSYDAFPTRLHEGQIQKPPLNPKLLAFHPESIEESY